MPKESGCCSSPSPVPAPGAGRRAWQLGLDLTVAGLIALKERLVIGHYMEMADASPPLRRVLHAFVVLVPLLVLASQGFGAAIARLTAIG